MTKRLITIVIAVVAAVGLAAAPAQASSAQPTAGTKLVQPMGWWWGI